MRFIPPMRILRFAKPTLRALILLFAAGMAVSAGPLFPPQAAGKLLPATLGDFKAASREVAFDEISEEKIRDFNAVSAAIRTYRSKKGDALYVVLILTRSDSSAYSLLTSMGCVGESGGAYSSLAGLEGRSCVTPAKVFFSKGPVYVNVDSKKGEPINHDALKDLAQLLAQTLDKGEGDIPALVKHLPGWESGGLQPVYSVSLSSLKNHVPNQPVFDAISFDGGVEVASAHYGDSQMVIVEFNTPQLATTNNQNILAKMSELRSTIPPAGSPSLPVYRRVGNYAVFVFNPANEQTANQLIDQVKYQQVVQWLGQDPFSYEQATREFTETTLGVFVAVVKTSGLALAACLAVGGFFGALLFSFRRARQRAKEAYSDADAMLRLNLDELTPESDPARLLGGGD